MRRDLIRKPPQSSFLSCEKDCETILKKLFVESKPYDEELIRLLVINEKDCLEGETEEVEALYHKKVKEMTLKKLIDEQYIRMAPKLKLHEFEEEKSYIIVSFDNFTTNESNPEFRDCLVHFDIVSPIDEWDIGNYRVRPLKIAGYIDGLLNKEKLSGIGLFYFVGCSELLLDDKFAGYSLAYQAIHWVDGDDKIPAE